MTEEVRKENASKFLGNAFSLSEKIILITGASSGIGAHLAEVFAQAGSKGLVLLARRQEKLEELKQKLEKLYGARVCTVKADVSQEADVKEGFRKAEQELGASINVVFNNAGILIRGEFMDMPLEDFDKMLSVNLRSCYLVSREAAQHFKNGESKGTLSIINISSAIVHVPQYGNPFYASTKAAVNHATKALQHELTHFAGQDKPIRVNAVSPGVFLTEINEESMNGPRGDMFRSMLRSKRLGKLEELNGIALLLASEASTYMLGTNIQVDGGEALHTM